MYINYNNKQKIQKNQKKKKNNLKKMTKNKIKIRKKWNK